MAHAPMAQGSVPCLFTFEYSSMQCTACRTHSNNLREYSRVVTIREHHKTIETAYLCPACRVMNALNPRYVVKHAFRDAHALDEARRLPVSCVRYVTTLIQPEIEEGDADPVVRRTALPC
jgi:hypothetical protein